jgi:hypothetical protein
MIYIYIWFIPINQLILTVLSLARSDTRRNRSSVGPLETWVRHTASVVLKKMAGFLWGPVSMAKKGEKW